MRTKLQIFLRSYGEGVYTIQNGANERNGLTAYFVDGHSIVLIWKTEITDLLQLVKFRSDYALREVVLSFLNLNVNFFYLPHKKHNVWPIKSVVVAIR